jgi:hypothetical protein
VSGPFKQYARIKEALKDFRIPGSGVTILKIFSPKNSARKMPFFAFNTASLRKKMDHKIGF